MAKATKCGVRYPVGTLPPPRAKWALYYWGYVVYHVEREACDTSFGKLSYHEQEDAGCWPTKIAWR